MGKGEGGKGRGVKSEEGNHRNGVRGWGRGTEKAFGVFARSLKNRPLGFGLNLSPDGLSPRPAPIDGQLLP